VLRHSNGTRFRADVGQGVEWPNDSFTSRRIAEGSVSLEPGTSGEAKPLDPTLNPREQAAANKPKKAEPKEESAPATNGNKNKPAPTPAPQPAPTPPSAA